MLIFLFLKYQNRKGTGYDKGQDSTDKDAGAAQDHLERRHACREEGVDQAAKSHYDSDSAKQADT